MAQLVVLKMRGTKWFIEAWWHTGMSVNGIIATLQWRHNEPDGLFNHQPRDCLLNRYSGADQIRYQRFASLAVVVTGEFPAQMTCNAEMFQFGYVIMPFIASMCLFFQTSNNVVMPGVI